MSLTSLPARAEPTNPIDGKFPTIELCKNEQGETRACYDLEEVKLLLKAWEERKILKEQNILLKDKVELQVSKLKYLEKVVETQEMTVRWTSENNLRLSKMWELENKKRHKAESSVTKRTSIAWTIAGSLGIFALGVIVAK